MHREFRTLLQDAKGFSDTIVAIFIDVRGFSSFSKTHDSAEVAIFVKHIYLRIIDEYFPDAAFFKPTGDGLLVVLSYNDLNVREAVPAAIATCEKIVDEFANFCKGEPMVNFEVPKCVGIGIARGTACRLDSTSKTLDYSGNVLNIAARLMDIARPSGVVFHSSIGIDLLPEELVKKYSKADDVYLRGVFENEPTTIFYNKQHTVINERIRHPLNEKWQTQRHESTPMQLENFLKMKVNTYTIILKTKPSRPEQISVQINLRRRFGGQTWNFAFPFRDFKYSYVGTTSSLILELAPLIGRLDEAKKAQHITPRTQLIIESTYPTIEVT